MPSMLIGMCEIILAVEATQERPDSSSLSTQRLLYCYQLRDKFHFHISYQTKSNMNRQHEDNVVSGSQTELKGSMFEI